MTNRFESNINSDTDMITLENIIGLYVPGYMDMDDNEAELLGRVLIVWASR